MIQIVPADPAWPTAFEAEAARLRQHLRGAFHRIEHVGSTAVPGLPAKPVIDIQISLPALPPAAELLESLAGLGYHFITLGEFDLVYPFFTRPLDWPSTHHLHLCLAGGHQEAMHLAFRDQLRADAALCTAYAALKRRLAAQYAGDTMASRVDYSIAKTDFVEAVLARAGLTWSQDA